MRIADVEFKPFNFREGKQRSYLSGKLVRPRNPYNFQEIMIVGFTKQYGEIAAVLSFPILAEADTMMNPYITAEGLLRSFVFTDGSPCGLPECQISLFSETNTHAVKKDIIAESKEMAIDALSKLDSFERIYDSLCTSTDLIAQKDYSDEELNRVARNLGDVNICGNPEGVRDFLIEFLEKSEKVGRKKKASNEEEDAE